ncbi:hypothetical protein L3Q82_013892 [Scortum barcoo]|uniref:Uncharacterized protein n=1 Tax=Scortum barcoo TaxID=214431 RepID=A0ACB8VV49_9TELE|nr:hypothetical protein L3Q82_013892 [Scortum barcoo]
MEVSSQDPPLMAMDLSKGYSVAPLTRGHTEAMDLAKKPEWYHRRPPSCSTEISSPYRDPGPRPPLALCTPTQGAPVHRRDLEQGPDSLGNYMNSTLTPGLDLYRDRAHGNLWHPGFYGPDQSGGPVPESSGGGERRRGERQRLGCDFPGVVVVAKEPLLCSPFIQDSVRHIVEPLSPAVSSLDEGRGCYHLPQPLSSPSQDSSYSEDSSDSSVDIPVHHTRPVVLLSDLSAVYGNAAESPVDISSDDSDVIEVSVTNEKKKSSNFKKSLVRETPPQSEEEKAPLRKVRRSTRVRKPVSEMPQFTCSARPAQPEETGGQKRRATQRSPAWTFRRERKSPPKESHEQQQQPLRRKVSHTRSISRKRKKPLTIRKTKKPRRTKQKQNHRVPPERRQKKESSAKKKTVTRRRKKRRPQTGPPAQFPPREPEIKLKYANIKEEKKDKKSGSFCPFVHLEKKTCTVVNYQEEEATVRSSRGGQPPASRSLSGFVPNTSCFQLCRFSSDGGRCQASLLCCLCGQTANAMGLGDLHGPYCPTGPSTDCHDQNCRTEGGKEEEEGGRGLAKSRSVNSSDSGHDCSLVSRPLPKVPLRLDECWIHEDCGIWSAGVFLIRGKLFGLEEAARLAQQTVCSACQQTGAIMGCFQKGCPRNYHYRCAIQSGCFLNEENFSIRCPEHKILPIFGKNISLNYFNC